MRLWLKRLKGNAYNHAVRLLSRREHGAHELATKLALKGYFHDDISEAIQKCIRLELQSDARFVENICRLRIRQGYGPVRIRKELQNLHIDSELIASALHQEKDNWLEYAALVLEKKFKEQIELTFSAIQKQKQFLLYRGFSIDTINMVFNNY